MTNPNTSPSAQLFQVWNLLQRIPAGRWLFSRLLSWKVPYTGTIKSQVLELRPGFCKVKLRDRRRVRNHLNSVHAVALVNLGEVTSGLAMLSGMPANVRGIVVNISTEYLKKARGNLIAECHTELPIVTEDIEYQVVTDIYDDSNEVVARTLVTWRLGLIE